MQSNPLLEGDTSQVGDAIRLLDGVVLKPQLDLDELVAHLQTTLGTAYVELNKKKEMKAPIIEVASRIKRTKIQLVIAKALVQIKDEFPEAGRVQLHLPESNHVWAVTWGNYKPPKKPQQNT